MAEAKNDGGTSSPNGEMKRAFSCKVCYEAYTKCHRFPISLNCGHTFCISCIKRISKNKKTTQCAICRRNTYQYKKLGKNIALMEILESQNMLVDDTNMDPPSDDTTDDEHGHANADEESATVERSNVEQFYEEANMLVELVRRVLPFQSEEYRLEKEQQLSSLIREMYPVEEHLSQAGAIYRQIMAKMREVQTDLTNRIEAEQSLDGQAHPTSSSMAAGIDHLLNYYTVPIDDPTPPSPRVYRIPMSSADSDSDDQRAQNRTRRSRRRRSPVPLRIRPPVQQLPSVRPEPQPIQMEEWGSSSGWGDTDRNGNTEGIQSTNQSNTDATNGKKRKAKRRNRKRHLKSAQVSTDAAQGNSNGTATRARGNANASTTCAYGNANGTATRAYGNANGTATRAYGNANAATTHARGNANANSTRAHRIGNSTNTRARGNANATTRAYGNANSTNTREVIGDVGPRQRHRPTVFVNSQFADQMNSGILSNIWIK